jgi:nucleoside-diphosphate-sugar epimerase
MKYKIGITGGTGCLGKTLLSSSKGRYQYSLFKSDIRDKQKVFQWVKSNNFHCIIHLAAIVPIKTVNKNKTKAYEVNYLGTKNLVDATANSNIKWFFFSSSSHVYKSNKKKISENSIKKPISFYGKTKYLAEKYIIKQFNKKKQRYCIGRIFSTSNINQKKNYLVPDLIQKIKLSKKKIKLKNLNHYRDFISMSEIVDIIFRLYKINFNGIINIGRGEGILLKDIAKVIGKKYKKKIEFIDDNKPTYLVADNTKLKKYFKLRKIQKIDSLIF